MITFKQYLSEQPAINTYFDKERMAAMTADRSRFIKNNTTSPSHYVDDTGNNYYFNRSEDGEILDLYGVDRNNNEFHVSKRPGGNTFELLRMMIDHCEKHGVLFSDRTHTKCSKKLWQDLIKSKPKNKRFFVIDEKTRQRKEVSSFDDSLWARNRNEHITLEMRNGH